MKASFLCLGETPEHFRVENCKIQIEPIYKAEPSAGKVRTEHEKRLWCVYKVYKCSKLGWFMNY